MAIIGRAGRRAGQLLRIKRIETPVVIIPVTEPDEPPPVITGNAGSPIGLLLLLTQAA